MLSRDELELRLLNQLSSVGQRVFDEMRTLSDEELFEFVRDLEDETVILAMLSIVRQAEEPEIQVVDGKEEIE